MLVLLPDDNWTPQLLIKEVFLVFHKKELVFTEDGKETIMLKKHSDFNLNTNTKD